MAKRYRAENPVVSESGKHHPAGEEFTPEKGDPVSFWLGVGAVVEVKDEKKD
jgi:hypothetical protein